MRRKKKEVISPIFLEKKQSSQEAWQNPGKDVNVNQTGGFQLMEALPGLCWGQYFS